MQKERQKISNIKEHALQTYNHYEHHTFILVTTYQMVGTGGSAG